MPAIEARRLVKSFGDVQAVDDASLTVEEGEFFGLLGPNGAGKTTLLSILTTMLRADGGTATVAGHDVAQSPDRVRREIGVVFQDPSLDEELTGRENLLFHAKLYKVPRFVREARLDELLQLVELTDRQHDVVKTYSGGMRRRLELARGLLHRPRILFLDEPTLGLDPQTRSHMWDYIRRLNKEQRVTMLLTTHYMDEADELCDRVAIIDRGRIIVQDTPAQLKAKLGNDLVYVRLNGTTQDLTPLLQAVPDVRQIKPTGEGLQIEVAEGATAIPRLLDAIRTGGGTVQSIQLKQPTLQDVFIKYTGRALREESMDETDRMRLFARGRRH